MNESNDDRTACGISPKRKKELVLPTRDEAVIHIANRGMTKAFRWIVEDQFIMAEAKAHEELDSFTRERGREIALGRVRKAYSLITGANPVEKDDLPNGTRIVVYGSLRSKYKLLVRRLVPQEQRDQFAPMVPKEHLHWTRGFRNRKESN